MQVDKVENSSIYIIMPMIMALRDMGYANVRFYSYRRWIGTLAVCLYQEMPVKCRSNEALIYPVMFCSEYGMDMALRYYGHDAVFNERTNECISAEYAAARFAEYYLKDQLPSSGCYSEGYYPWLESVIAVCPHKSFPVTNVQDPEPYFSENIEFYPGHEECNELIIPRPPGLDKMVEPKSTMESDIAWKADRAMAKEPSAFKKWSEKATAAKKSEN